MLVAAHLGDGHAAGGVLEGLAEGLLAGAQGLLLAFEPDQGALHVGAQPCVADGDGGLEGVHLQGLAAPGAGAPAVARAVGGDHAQEFASGTAGGVHRGEEAVRGVPLVLEAGRRPVGEPLRYVVLVEDPALGVRDEPQVAPGLAHGQAAVPGGAGADPAGDEGFGGGVAGEGGDDEVTVGAYEIDAGQLVSEAVHDSVGDRLQGVGQAAGGVHVRHHLVKLPQGRKTDVRLRLGLHAQLSPRPRQHSRILIADSARACARSSCSVFATESQRAVHPVHRVNKIWLL